MDAGQSSLLNGHLQRMHNELTQQTKVMKDIAVALEKIATALVLKG